MVLFDLLRRITYRYGVTIDCAVYNMCVRSFHVYALPLYLILFTLSIHFHFYSLPPSFPFHHSIERILALSDSICISFRLSAFAPFLCSLSFFVFQLFHCAQSRALHSLSFSHSLSFIALAFFPFFEFYSLPPISFFLIFE